MAARASVTTRCAHTMQEKAMAVAPNPQNAAASHTDPPKP